MEAFDNSVYGVTMSDTVPVNIAKPKETHAEEALAHIVKEFSKLGLFYLKIFNFDLMQWGLLAFLNEFFHWYRSFFLIVF